MLLPSEVILLLNVIGSFLKLEKVLYFFLIKLKEFNDRKMSFHEKVFEFCKINRFIYSVKK
jgi:hypothetical protein